MKDGVVPIIGLVVWFVLRSIPGYSSPSPMQVVQFALGPNVDPSSLASLQPRWINVSGNAKCIDSCALTPSGFSDADNSHWRYRLQIQPGRFNQCWESRRAPSPTPGLPKCGFGGVVPLIGLVVCTPLFALVVIWRAVWSPSLVCWCGPHHWFCGVAPIIGLVAWSPSLVWW